MLIQTFTQKIYVIAASTAKYTISLFLAVYIEHFKSVEKYLAFTLLVLLVDLVTGINAAKKRGEAVHSYGLRRTTKKFGELGIAIVIARFFEIVYIPDLKLVFAVSIYISIHEMYSVYENISQTSGISIINVLSKFINKNKNDSKEN